MNAIYVVGTIYLTILGIVALFFNLTNLDWTLKAILVVLAVVFASLSVIYQQVEKKSDEGKHERISQTGEKMISAQEELTKTLKLVLKEQAIVSGEWKELDISSAVPPVTVYAASLLFKSKGGIVTGYVQGDGYDERYPFDTSVNNNMPIGVKLKSPKIKYTITSPNNQNLPFTIFVAGYKDNLRGISTE